MLIMIKVIMYSRCMCNTANTSVSDRVRILVRRTSRFRTALCSNMVVTMTVDYTIMITYILDSMPTVVTGCWMKITLHTFNPMGQEVTLSYTSTITKSGSSTATTNPRKSTVLSDMQTANTWVQSTKLIRHYCTKDFHQGQMARRNYYPD